MLMTKAKKMDMHKVHDKNLHMTVLTVLTVSCPKRSIRSKRSLQKNERIIANVKNFLDVRAFVYVNNEIGVHPSRTCFIGDNAANCLAAETSVGWKTYKSIDELYAASRNVK